MPVRLWVIEYDCKYYDDAFSGVMVVSSETRDSAEELVKQDLTKKGYNWTRIISSALPITIELKRAVLVRCREHYYPT